MKNILNIKKIDRIQKSVNKTVINSLNAKDDDFECEITANFSDILSFNHPFL
mgnify:CR=1 FL=1